MNLDFLPSDDWSALSIEEMVILLWHNQRRPNQTPPTPLPYIWFLLGGRGSGKALDLNTKIPTPEGFKLLKDIHPGQIVFDENGNQCVVKATYDIIPERAYELTFSDKTKIIAGGEHLWATNTVPERRKKLAPVVRSTDEIVQTLKHKNGQNIANNHSIALQGSLEIEEKQFNLDPWLLGYWLGNGCKDRGAVTIADIDIHLLDNYNLGKPQRKPNANCITITVEGLHSGLSDLNLLDYYDYHTPKDKIENDKGFKHVPEQYLWASEPQRLSLLRGLMDSDGYADEKKNVVEFCSTTENLADSVLFLARSLGEKPVKSEGRAKLNGVDYGPKYRVTWSPANYIPFTLKRKFDRITKPTAQISRRHHRMITDAVEVSIRPMKCLTVDSPNHLFLAGEQMIPTHNTLTGANHVFEYCKNLPNTPENRIVRGALVSETLGDVKMTMIEGATGLRSIVPKSLELKYNRSLGEYSFYLPGPPYREVFLKAYSSQSPDQLRGPQHHIIWLDEPAKCADSDENPENENTTWSNLEFGLRLGTHPHVVVTGTPTPCKLVKFLRDHEDSVVANMSSLENLNNLPDSQRKKFERLNPNSRTYQQEVMAQILEDNPDSQFDQTTINHYRKAPPETEEYPPNSGEFRPVPRAKVLGWDPSMTSNIESDECGLVLALKTQEHDPLHTQRTYTHTHAYILEDYSGNYSPAEQALKVIDVILEEEVDELVFEQNQGADFIMTLLQTALKGHPRMKDHQYSVKELRKKKTRIGPITRWRITTPIHTFIVNGIHAKQGKITRAETASLAYENGDVHHPLFPLLKLEEQMVAWNPLNTKKSPDRLDAVVYTLLHIFGFEGALTAPRHGKLVKPEGKNIGTGVDILTGTIPNREKPSRYAELYSGDMRNVRTTKTIKLNPEDPERFLRDILQDRGRG